MLEIIVLCQQIAYIHFIPCAKRSLFILYACKMHTHTHIEYIKSISQHFHVVHMHAAAFIHALSNVLTWNYCMHVSLLLYAPRKTLSSQTQHKQCTHSQNERRECDRDTEFLCDSISMINRSLFLCVFLLCRSSFWYALQTKIPWHGIILFASYHCYSDKR